MMLSGHQPGYLPYIGFFHKAMLSDVFVFSDHVQYVKKEWHNRNKIRLNNNGWMWLTVPVHCISTRKINNVTISHSQKWQEKHWKAIVTNYNRAPFFKNYRSFFTELYSKKWEKLVDLNETIIRYIFEELKIEPQIFKSSDLNLVGKKTAMIVELCQKLNADTYLSGIGARAYLEEAKFKENNIKLVYQDFHHPIYPQRADPFIPNLSILDLIFNVGNEKSRQLILNSGGMIPAYIS